MEFQIENNKIIINGAIINFPGEVWEVLEIEIYLIVLLKLGINNNVFCVDVTKNEICWQIDNTNPESCPITYMEIIKNNLFLSSSCSYFLKVDIPSGAIIYKQFDNAK